MDADFLDLFQAAYKTRASKGERVIGLSFSEEPVPDEISVPWVKENGLNLIFAGFVSM